jgi:hypothetical protein
MKRITTEKLHVDADVVYPVQFSELEMLLFCHVRSVPE